MEKNTHFHILTKTTHSQITNFHININWNYQLCINFDIPGSEKKSNIKNLTLVKSLTSFLSHGLKSGTLKSFVTRIYSVVLVIINMLVTPSVDKSLYGSIRENKKLSLFKI